MKVSSRSQYAITAMLELAIHEKTRLVTILDISRKQKISLSYLEQLFASLRRHELVRGRRGPGGGYVLARDVKNISIADIVMAVDGIEEKTDEEPIISSTGVSSEALWNNVSQRIYHCLCDITLSDFLHQPKKPPIPEKLAKEGWKPEVAFRRRA